MKKILADNKLPNGEPLDEARRQLFKREVTEFNPEDEPESIPKEIEKMECHVFGHLCPVFFVSEDITEQAKDEMFSKFAGRDEITRDTENGMPTQ